MIGKKSIFGGFLSLIFFASIVFFVIYFLAPDVSLRLFGISFNAEEYLESSLEEAFEAAGMSRDEVEAIAGGDISELLPFIMAKAGEGMGNLASYITSEEGAELIQSCVDYVNSGAGTILDYFESQREET